MLCHVTNDLVRFYQSQRRDTCTGSSGLCWVDCQTLRSRQGIPDRIGSDDGRSNSDTSRSRRSAKPVASPTARFCGLAPATGTTGCCACNSASFAKLAFDMAKLGFYNICLLFVIYILTPVVHESKSNASDDKESVRLALRKDCIARLPIWRTPTMELASKHPANGV